MHIRYAGMCERSGRVTVTQLPPRLVAPGAPPPPEAFQEVWESGLMDRLGKTANLFCDGAHAWRLLVGKHNKTKGARVRLENVAHYAHEFTRDVGRPRRGQSSIAGTQAIDQRWRWMKAYIPHCLKARWGRTVNPLIDTYVYS